MSFHRSSSAFEVIGSQLFADCRNTSGIYCPSSLDLDLHLGNKNGAFDWNGKNFSKSARDVHFISNGSSFILHATLRNRNGAWREAKTDLSDRLANHNGKLVYIGGARDGSRGIGPFDDLIDSDPFAATFSGLKDFAQDLTESLFGAPSPPIGTRSASAAVPSREKANSTNIDDSTNLPSEKDSEEKVVPSDNLSYEIPKEYEEAKTPVPEVIDEVDLKKGTTLAATTSLNELSAEQQEEFQYELIMRTIKQFLLQGPGATATSNINEEGQRELVFSRGEEKFTLLASKIRPEILFDQDEYRRSCSASSPTARCLTPETVEGDDDDDTVLI
ncbi:MAG: hypothetical protein LQ340_003581 [Diploschistes diacapsis]|nr:MAG: hypothetical protein LQ340_003581 [Diploschistes diacapsis]